jgi:hypothetical protein
MKFDLNFQELMEIEQGAPDFTWMTDHSWKKFGIQIFLIFWTCSKKLIRIHSNLDLVYLGFGLIT